MGRLCEIVKILRRMGSVYNDDRIGNVGILSKWLTLAIRATFNNIGEKLINSGLWDICTGVFTPKTALGFVVLIPKLTISMLEQKHCLIKNRQLFQGREGQTLAFDSCMKIIL